SILISELLFNHDINNSQTIDLNKSEINIQKTSDIPIIAHQEDFDKIFCFQKIEHLKHYDEIIGHIESVYACSSNIKATEEMPIFVNKDKNCPFRKQSLMKFTHLKSVVEIDSFENIISLVENGKGIALLPKWLNKRANIKPYDQDIVLIPFYQYEKQNQSR
ncbi:LysR family transcriptional regulator, partial [Streptococcus cristatus]